MCPISSRAKGHRVEVLLGDDTETSGVVISDQLRCYDWRGRRFEFRERAPERILDEVLAKIAALLEL